MHRVCALALPGVVAFDLGIPAQVFGSPHERERYAFSVCAEAPGLVATSTSFAVHAAAGLEALAAADTVVVPGYWSTEDPGPAVGQALRAAHVRGARVVSVCTGAFALAAAGLLDGRRATTHWRNAADLAARFPAVEVDPDVLFCCDGSIHTSAGVAAGIDLCLELVRQDHGAAVAAAIGRRMVVAPHRTGGQRQFVDRPLPARTDGSLAATRAWALERLEAPLPVARLAGHAGWSPRTFARRFEAETGTTPLRWLTAQRVQRARELLEASDLSVEAIAGETGLGGAANLRRRFAEATGTTPTAYRQAFRGPTATGATRRGRGRAVAAGARRPTRGKAG